MANFMYILLYILENCPINGENFLVKAYLEPNYHYFNYSYKFNENGDIVSKEKRHFTDRNQYETDRYKRIAIESVYDYNEKDNRQNTNDLTSKEHLTLAKICQSIETGLNIEQKKTLIQNLIESIENRIIRTL